MNRIKFDYHVESSVNRYAPEACTSPIDQSVVGSVFIVNPATGLLEDCLSQVINDPTNPRNDMLLSLLQRVGVDKPSNLSDDDLLKLVRSRYAQTPSELSRMVEYLKSLVNSSEPAASESAASEPSSSEPAASEPASSNS